MEDVYKEVLTEKIKRTRFVARNWMTSVDALQPVWCPSDFGWNLNKWYREDETGWYY